MNRLFKLCIKALLISALLTVPLSGTVFASDNNTIDIVVSPHVLNIESNGGSISIHTDIDYDPAADAALTVNGTTIEIWTFADLRGNLVVKCSIETVKDIVVDAEEATFFLTANDNGVIYTGTDTIAVIRVIPQKV